MDMPEASAGGLTSPVPRFGVVVLTMGQRPDDLRRGLESLIAQKGVSVDVVVVGNGWQPEGLPAGVRGHALDQNVGIPAGRNAGVPLVSGDLLFFLDDDAALAAPDTLARFAAIFAQRPEVGLIQPRVVDPAGRPAQPRRCGRARSRSGGTFSIARAAGRTCSSTPMRASSCAGGSGTSGRCRGTPGTSRSTTR